jgi:flagellar hook-associated protein 3 FlgL
MRLSTNMMYELGMRGIQRPQAEQMELQERISSGRRVNKPSDDPIAAAAAISLNQAKAVNEQFKLNAQNAESTLGQQVSALNDVNDVLQSAKTLIVKAGNPALQNDDRVALGIEAQALYDQLLSIANRSDGSGQYLFSGFQGSTQPFAETAPGVVAFAGDEGQRMVQIGPQRRISVGDSGAEVFQRAKEGNGTFVATPRSVFPAPPAAPVIPGNAGNGVAGEGTVRNLAAWNGTGISQDYTIKFDVSAAVPPVTTYDIVDNATSLSVLTGAASGAGPYTRTYNSGSTIDFQRQAGDPVGPAFDAGIQMQITGTPADGDTFTIDRAANKDIFSTVHDLISRLSNALPVGLAARADYDNALTRTSSSLDSAMDHILTITASTGVRLKELDSSRSTSQDLGLRYDQDLARLQDLDYAAAISELAQKQFSLEAAQKSYVSVTSLKLFDFIR